MNCIDKEVAEKLSKEVSSYIIEQVKHNMDKSIEERAKEWAESNYYPDGESETQRKIKINAYAKVYCKIASKQKQIDIDKACEWLRARNVLTEASLEGFRKAMEE